MNKENTETFDFKAGDTVFAWIMLVCGFLYWHLIKPAAFGAGVTIFAAVLCAAAFSYLRLAGHRQTKVSLLWLAIIAASALTFLLFDNIFIKSLDFLFISAAFIYWISLTTGRNLERRLSVYILGDMVNQMLVVPFSNFGTCFYGVRRLFSGNRKGKSLLAGLFGLLVILPVLAWVVSLLAQADAAFESLIDHLRFTVSTEIVLEIIFGVLVACYLYGLLYGDSYGRNTARIGRKSFDKGADALHIVPGVTVYTALTALNIVFLIYFLSQMTYLFSAFGGRLPELMTYAAYARRGFFELCAVASINLAVLTIAHLLVIRGKTALLKGETVALCVFTMMLIATAVSKMAMYINYYGLTQLRIYTTWFMILLFFIFAVIAVRQFKGFNATRIIVVGFVVLFMALSFGNSDGLIAAYNIGRYEKGALDDLDLVALGGLSDAAVPYLYELYCDTEDQSLKDDIRAVLVKDRGNEEGRGEIEAYRYFNLQRHRAELIRESL